MLENISDFIEKYLYEEISEGDGVSIVKFGVSQKLDEAREQITKTHTWIQQYQDELISEYSISNLKLKYTSSSGYYIEIPKSKNETFAEGFILLQNLTNTTKYTSKKLQSFEGSLLDAEDRVRSIEEEVYQEIQEMIISCQKKVYKASTKVAYVDFLSNASFLMNMNNYNIPKISLKKENIILEGRHLVIEKSRDCSFVTNDMYIGGSNSFMHIISGPNMGGKSTYLRQNAINIILAHMGYPIPASEGSSISLTDRVFSRVGSGDNLFSGQSTFMVEMQEVSYILHHATHRSFVVVDEIGRGTSTHDGIALAWSIYKYLHNKVKSNVLFATHYHELIDFSQELEGSKNFHVSASQDIEGETIFLHKLLPGGIKESFGIEIGKQAGLPQEILKHAYRVLDSLEKKDIHTGGAVEKYNKKQESFDFVILNNNKIIENIKSIEIDTLSPLEALQELSQLQRQLENSE